MSQVDLFGARTEPPPELVRARFDVDCTPSPVALQGVEAVTRGWLHEGDAPRVLDLCAGSGAWARAVRLLFPRAHITALEARADERASLERWADDVVIGDVAEVLAPQSQPERRADPVELAAVEHAIRGAAADAEHAAAEQRLRALATAVYAEPDPAPALGPFDLVIGNPPFSLVDPRKPPKKGQPGKSRLRAFEVLVVAARNLLTPSGRLALYVPAAWWLRGGDVAALAQQHQPFRQLNVPLPVSHRGAGQQAATDAYAIYAWSHPSVPACNGWHTLDLPILSAADRRWREVPGTET